MEIAEIHHLIAAGFPGCELYVAGEGCSFSIIVIGDVFDGLPLVQRQKKVLATVQEPLATGTLHAISMKVYTPSEWAQAKTEEARPL